MHYAILFPSKHVTAADIAALPNQEFTGVIERIAHGEDVQNTNGQSSKKSVVYFRGGKKGWVLNKTNAVKIAKSLGEPDVDKWIGHSVTICVSETAAFGADKVPCIRVRSAK